MTGDWDFYFLHVDDKPSSMYVNLGIRNSAPKPSLPFMAYARIHMNSPRDDGLSSQEEFDTLMAIEDQMKAQLVGEETEYVGRCTTNSCRDFFFYIAQTPEWERRVAKCMNSFPTYTYEADTREDADWSTYLSYIYPNETNRQMIENRRVCDALTQNGDKLHKSREIDHWTHFADATSRDAFVAEANQLGYSVRSLSEPTGDDNRYGAHMWRVDVPAFDSIDDVTLPLFKLAAIHGGEYDGWESIVVT